MLIPHCRILASKNVDLQAIFTNFSLFLLEKLRNKILLGATKMFFPSYPSDKLRPLDTHLKAFLNDLHLQTKGLKRLLAHWANHEI